MTQENFEPQDPFELVGMVIPGEPGELEAMAECFVEEYVRLGWDEKRLMTIFRSPMFLATNRIYRQKGEAYVRDLIHGVLARWGGYSFGTAPLPEEAPPSCAIMDELMQEPPASGESGTPAR